MWAPHFTSAYGGAAAAVGGSILLIFWYWLEDNRNQIVSPMTKIEFYFTWTKNLIENLSDYLHVVRSRTENATPAPAKTARLQLRLRIPAPKTQYRRWQDIVENESFQIVRQARNWDLNLSGAKWNLSGIIIKRQTLKFSLLNPLNCVQTLKNVFKKNHKLKFRNRLF